MTFNSLTDYISVLNHTERWFIVLDAQEIVLGTSLEILALFGIETADCEGKALREVLSDEQIFKLLDDNSVRLHASKPTPYSTHNSGFIWLSWEKHMINQDYIFLIAKDMSGVMQHEQELISMKNVVEEKAQVLATIVHVSDKLLSAQDMPETLYETFLKIGEASQVDRAYYFEKNKSDDLFCYKVEWIRNGIKPEINNPRLQNVDLGIYEEGCVLLKRGEPVAVYTAALEEGLVKDILLEQEIVSMINLPIFVNAELTGFIGFDICTSDKTWTEDEISLFVILSNIISKAFERLETKKRLALKASILSAIGEVNEMLFKSEDIVATMIDCFPMVGEAAQVDRVYFFERTRNKELFSQKVEWTRGSVSSQIDNPVLQNIDVKVYPDFLEKLQSGQPYIIYVAELEEGGLKDLLNSQDIISLLNIPISVFGELYGFLGFDDCSSSLKWSDDEISILVSLANNISTAFQRNKNQAKLERKTAIMQAVGVTAEKLFKTEDIFKTLFDSFSLIGSAADVDRVYYFEKNKRNRLFSQRLEWTKNHIKPEIDNPNLQNVDMTIFDFYEKNILKGMPYILKTDELEDLELKEVIAEQNIISLLNIPITVFGEVYGILGFDDCTKHKTWRADEVSMFVSLSNSLANAIEKFENQKRLQNKADMLLAIGKTSERLLDTNNAFEVIEESFAIVGKAIQADRVYYFEKQENGFFSQKNEWTNIGVSKEIDNPLLQNMNLDEYPSLKEKVFAGLPYIFNTHEMPLGKFRDMMVIQNILTILNIPLKVHGEIYGFIGFDDCTTDRVWSQDELSVLSSLANNIANAIERTENQQKIINSERNFREMNETIDDVFWLYNIENSRIDYISPLCKKFFGLDQERFYEKHDAWVDYVLLEDQERIHRAHREIEEVGMYEVQYRIKVDTTIKWIYEKSFAIKNDAGTFSRNTGVCIDITDTVLKQQELERLFELTNQQNEKLTNFAHIISHNIRSHSSNLSSLMEFLSDSPTKEETELYMSLMQKSTDKLAETIKNLNDIITIQNYVELEKTSLNLYEEIEKTRHSLSAEIQNSKASIKNAVPENVVINFVPAYLESILLNFLSNALKYRSNDRQLEVEFNLTRVNNHWRLAISDNGLGIDLDKNGHKLFGMFKTLHKNSDAKGMGLFIAKSQIEAMQGRVEVQSKIDQGTTFFIYFHDKN
jgi:PAS domain S-box-containing protein